MNSLAFYLLVEAIFPAAEQPVGPKRGRPSALDNADKVGLYQVGLIPGTTPRYARDL